MIRLLVFPHHAGLRVDQYLAAATPLSRRKARSLLAEGRVSRNGKVGKVASRAVEAGDVIDLTDAEPGAEAALGLPSAPELPPLALAFEDADLAAADKPAGMLSQPAEERPGSPAVGELACDELLLLHLSLREGRRAFLRLVHRIDRMTSGLLLFARSEAALKPLAEAWREGTVERRYQAIVEGAPPFENRRIEAPIARVAGGAWRFEVASHGLTAATEVRVVERGERFSRVECRLSTGRTHQVRVHLAHLGFPVAGDRLYGAAVGGAPWGAATWGTAGDPAPARPLLHAAELALPHPRTGARLVIRSPLPADMQRLPV